MRGFNGFYIVVLSLVGLIVVAVQVLHLPTTISIVAAGVGALVCAVRYAIDRLGGARSSGGGEDPARAARRAAARETRRRVAAVRRRLRELVRQLKLAQDRPRLRYREAGGLPWWLVLGPDGHGKSTLVAAAPGCREVAPGEPDEPRLYIADDAVFLELPGDPPPEAAPALAALFKAVHKRRRRAPLTGVLVVHRADALLAEADANAAMRSVRAHLDVAADTLAIQVPVLLVVSQLDRVAGFAELVAGCPAVTRALGVTLPLREGKASVRAAVGERLAAPDGVLDWIRQRCHALVGRADPGTHRQSRLYGFWQQFDRLAARAAEAAGQLAAAPLPGGDPLRVRGVYFSAARPDPVAPDDLWAAQLAQRAGGSLPASDGDTPACAAFVADLFAVEIARDGQYAARLRRHYRRRLAAAVLVALALATTAAGIARQATHTARTHETLLQTTLDSADAITRRPPSDLPPLAELDLLRRAVVAFRDPDRPGRALLRTDRLADVAALALRDAVCRRVLRPLVERSTTPLRQFSARFLGGGLPAAREHEEAHDLLRSYLLLTAPADAHEPAPWGDDQGAWLRDRTVAMWSDVDPDGPDPRRAEILAAHVQLLDPAAASAGDGDPCTRSGHARAAERDAKLVADVRQILLRNPPERDLVDRMTDRLDRDRRLRAVTVRDLTTANYARGEASVPPAFTRQGWLAFAAALRAELDDRSDQPWVVGRPGVRDTRAQRCAKLRDIYVARHIKAWNDFVRGLDLTSPATWPQAAAIYEELAEDTPLVPVFAAVAEHTQGLPKIPCTEAPMADTLSLILPQPPALPAPDARDAAEVAREFHRLVEFTAPPAGAAARPGKSALDSYHERLQDVRSSLDRALDNPAEQLALCSKLKDAIDDVDGMLQRGNLGGWKDPLTTLLLPPLTSLSLLCRAGEAERLNALWCASVVLPLQRTIADRYPFAPVRGDARLADVELLFHPQTGEIAKFRDKELSAHVRVGGHDVTAAPYGTGAEFHLSPAVVDLLDAAHELGLLLYGNGAVGLDAGLTMRCENSVSKVVLRIDEAQNTYFCSIDQAQQIHWPGKSEPRRAELEAFGANARTDIIPRVGEFGLFRLLEEGTPTHRPGQSTFTISIVLPRHNFGSFQLTFHPREFRGGNLFYGFSGGRFLAPFRARGFVDPPDALWSELGFTCREEGPLP